MGESAVPEHFKPRGGRLPARLVDAGDVERREASNIKDVSTERGRDPVRRKSVVCGESSEGGGTETYGPMRPKRNETKRNGTERNETKATPLVLLLIIIALRPNDGLQNNGQTV